MDDPDFEPELVERAYSVVDGVHRPGAGGSGASGRRAKSEVGSKPPPACAV